MDSSDSVSEFLLFKFNIFVKISTPPNGFTPPSHHALVTVGFARGGLSLGGDSISVLGDPDVGLSAGHGN